MMPQTIRLKQRQGGGLTVQVRQSFQGIALECHAETSPLCLITKPFKSCMTQMDNVQPHSCRL